LRAAAVEDSAEENVPDADDGACSMQTGEAAMRTMAAAEFLDDAQENVDGWLQQAFAAERAPAKCRLPAPRVTEVAPEGRRRQRAHAVRGSFVWMLALSATALLLQI
jgi:hypothetical protein